VANPKAFWPFVAACFQELVPRKERHALQRSLRWEEEEYYNDTLGRWDTSRANTPDEANDQAQSLHRYRLITFSNFLKTIGAARRFQPNLSEILEDSQPGTVVLLIGGKDVQYPEIYKYINSLAVATGFQLKLRGELVSSAATGVAGRPFVEAARLYSRLQTLAPDSSERTEAVRELFTSKPRGATSQVWMYRKFSWRKAARLPS
jgi:hypothetical protein